MAAAADSNPEAWHLVAGGNDHDVHIVDMKSGDSIKTMAGHRGRILAVEVLRDGRIASGSGGSESVIKVWNPSSGECEMTLSGHSSAIRCLAHLSDGTLASGAQDEKVMLWDLSTGKCTATLSEHSGSVYCLTTVRQGGTLVSGSRDSSIKLWQAGSTSSSGTLSGHTSHVLAVAELPGDRLVSGSDDHNLCVWDMGSMTCLHTLASHSRKVWNLTVLSTGQVASGDSGGNVKVWDVQEGCLVRSMTNIGKHAVALAPLPDGSVVVGGNSRRLQQLTVPDGTEVASYLVDTSTSGSNWDCGVCALRPWVRPPDGAVHSGSSATTLSSLLDALAAAGEDEDAQAEALEALLDVVPEQLDVEGLLALAALDVPLIHASWDAVADDPDVLGWVLGRLGEEWGVSPAAARDIMALGAAAPGSSVEELQAAHAEGGGTPALTKWLTMLTSA